MAYTLSESQIKQRKCSSGTWMPEISLLTTNRAIKRKIKNEHPMTKFRGYHCQWKKQRIMLNTQISTEVTELK